MPYKDAAKRNNQSKVWQRNNPKKVYATHILKLYGITIEDYDRMFIAQNGKCAVCGNENIVNGKRRMLCVDHDHKTGKIRGLLCKDCNLAIGHVKDNPDIALKIANYLNALIV